MTSRLPVPCGQKPRFSSIPNSDTFKSILNMAYGTARRERLLALLKKGYRICLNFSYGGSWNSKDKDIQRLLKQKKVKAHKQYTLSAVTPHMNHTYLGIA